MRPELPFDRKRTSSRYSRVGPAVIKMATMPPATGDESRRSDRVDRDRNRQRASPDQARRGGHGNELGPREDKKRLAAFPRRVVNASVLDRYVRTDPPLIDVSCPLMPGPRPLLSPLAAAASLLAAGCWSADASRESADAEVYPIIDHTTRG